MRLVELPSVAVHSNILELHHIEFVAKHIELVAGNGVVVFLHIRHSRHVFQRSLVKPFHQQLESSGIVVWQFQFVRVVLSLLFLGHLMADEFGLEIR